MNLVIANTLNGNSGRRQIEETMVPVSNPLTSSMDKHHDEDTDTLVMAHTLSSEGADASEDGAGRGTPLVVDTTGITSAKNYSNPKPGDPCHPLAEGQHAPLLIASPLTTTYGKTLDHAGSKGAGPDNAIVDLGMVRRLTPVECERLQNFPDGFTCRCQPLDAYAIDPEEASLRCTCPDGPRYRALGNAVTTSVVEWLGRRLRIAISDQSLTVDPIEAP